MSNQPNAPAFSSARSNFTRHRLIVASCFVFAAGVLAVSTVDFKALISRPAILHWDGAGNSKSARLEYLKTPAQLNLKYAMPFSEQTSREGIRQITEINPDGKVLFGFVTPSGQVFAPKFYAMGAFENGRAAVQATAGTGPYWGVIDTDGNYVITPRFYDEPKFKHGVACVQLADPSFRTAAYAIVDTSGQVLARLKTNAEPMGRAFLVSGDHCKKGLIDTSGKTILPSLYDRIEYFNDDNWNPYNESVGWDAGNRYFNAACFDLTPTDSESQDDSSTTTYLRVWHGDRCGVVDDTGKVVLPVQYTTIDKCNNGISLVTVDGQREFLDSKGNNLIAPFKFDTATEFGDVIGVVNHNRWSLINSQGKPIKSASFDGPILDWRGHWFSEGRAPVNVKGKVGFLNEKGELCIKPQFVFATGFKNGAAEVWNGQHWGYIDTSGRFITQQPFSDVMPFHNGAARVTVPGPLWLLVRSQALDDFNAKAERFRNANSSRPQGSTIQE